LKLLTMSHLHSDWNSFLRRLIFLLVLTFSSHSLLAEEPNLGAVVLETKGYVVPAAQVTVSPKVSGHVVELLIEEGKRVKAGDVLARLDPTEYEAALRIGRAKLKLAEAELLKTKEAGSKADLTIAEAKVEIAQAQLALAQYRLDSTVIRAPINGTVLSKRAEVGTLINPKGHQGVASLCDLADLRTMEVEIWVQEADLSKFAKGQRCQIQLDAFPQAKYRGSVARIQPIADRARAVVGVRVRAEIPQNDESFRPEMAAIVTIGSKK
jgi:RND family efflux transporter MFP subunit